jgi:hypothetical protein
MAAASGEDVLGDDPPAPHAAGAHFMGTNPAKRHMPAL